MDEEKKSNGAGIGIGLIICGVVLLGFPSFAELSGWPVAVFYGVGLVALLVGILGACHEIFGGKG